MPKIITSPVARFAGTVTLADPLIVPQCLAFEQAIGGGREFFDVTERDGDTVYLLKPGVMLGVVDADKLPAIVAIVEKWELENFPGNVTADTFPMTPRADSHRLLMWLWEEITKIYVGEVAIPNE